MQLSIVSGTYNRLQHLADMVNSVRLSIGIGITYEIILVDGGSTDGTIEWAEEQEDIVFIEQYELLGAVKAFQEGFAAARGEYVIIGNDDITFINESIRTALSFMEDNPEVGIGCFQQDRYGKDFHVEYMHAVINGTQHPVPYGQVCIIPRWLGDKVGWWDPGVGYHTYAGDNELSCNVLELGYTVVPIPCACIHDDVAKDALRERNNVKPGQTVHPDSQKWVKKWTRNGLLGPVIPMIKVRRDFTKHIRLLYAPIYEQWSKIQYKSKRGLREAFIRAGYIVDEVDYVKNPDYIFDAANAFQPDIILTQFHAANIFNAAKIYELKQEHPYALFINWNGDYFPENYHDPKYMKMLRAYDLSTFVTTDVAAKYDAANIRWAYWQIGFEEPLKPVQKDPRNFDVIFLGNSHYNFRVELGRTLRSLDDLKVGLFGTWPDKFRPDGDNLYDYDAGCSLYMASKIAISDGRPGATFVSNRIFQSMVAGCFTLQQWFEGIYDLLEFEEGVHFVTYKNTRDLPNLIRYWLENDEERDKIALAGQKRTRERHSFDVRVKQLEALLAERVHV